MNIPEVHLTPKRTITRQQTDTRAFPLSEQGLPVHDGTPESVHKIIEFLNVEKSPRYIRNTQSTFCNIYAYDFAMRMGAYVPRVFWTDKAIQEQNFKASYGVTVVEMNANALYDWFKTRSSLFGWEGVKNNAEAQKFANEGKCVIAVAANKNRKRSGHIVAVVPETDKVKAVGSGGIIVHPVMSQAGATNKAYFASKWWDGHEPLKIYVKK